MQCPSFTLNLLKPKDNCSKIIMVFPVTEAFPYIAFGIVKSLDVH